MANADAAQSPRKRRDWGEAAFFLALCAALYYATLGFDSAPPALSQNIPPEFFPQLLLALIAFLACLLPTQPARAPAGLPSAKTALAAAALAVVCALFQFAGAAPAMFACCLFLPLLWGERRAAWLGVYALLYPAAVYGLFGFALNVRFP